MQLLLLTKVNSHKLCYYDQLRTQALASLHCGLQNNQGIPVTHVAKWLAMEVLFILDLIHIPLVKNYQASSKFLSLLLCLVI